jgi:hypothetical protein
LAREVEGINMRLQAEFRPSKSLIVGISIIYGDEDVDVNAGLIELRLPPDGKEIRAQLVNSQDATRYDSRQRKIHGTFFRVLIAITVMSEFAMNSVHAADWMFLRSDGDRETYIDMSSIEVDGSSNSVT